jgi:LPS sulfotransferase NodH
MQMKPTIDQEPIRLVTDERLDFNHFGPLRKSYIVASSHRSGSVYLCSQLWETGVLGAPTAYLGRGRALRGLMKRFNVFSYSDYIASLIAHRTSRNGVFGMKEHFTHFEACIKEFPAFLEVLSPMTYIYLSREDKVAQAVSMAKALQTDEWTSRRESGRSPSLRYDRELIENCMKEIALQDASWMRWFETHGVTPFEMTYEGLTADTAGTVRSIVELLGVQNDEPDKVDLPPARKQSDDTNHEWIERFERETRASAQLRGGDDRPMAPRAVVKDADPGPPASGTHFCDRYDRLVENLPAGQDSAIGFINPIRLRRRYDAIVLQNREMFHNARVLDILKPVDFWSLGALDAGAAHVVGVEASRKNVEAAEKSFAEYAVKPDAYRFVRSGILAAMKKFDPETFDVILCRFSEDCFFLDFFAELSRLKPKHIVLDTRVGPGKSSAAHFVIAKGSRTINVIPNHGLIRFLCESQFRWRVIDWSAIGITHWAGVQSYARDRRRTYVLDRLS